MVLEKPKAILDIVSITVGSGDSKQRFYSGNPAREIWRLCDKRTGYLDVRLNSGEQVRGKVINVGYVPARIGGAIRLFVFEYAREHELVGAEKISEERTYTPCIVDVTKH